MTRACLVLLALVLTVTACSDSDSVVTVATSSTSSTSTTTTETPSTTGSTEPGPDTTVDDGTTPDTVPLDGGAVSVFFSDVDDTDCSRVAAWARPELAEMTALEAALTHLIAGPTEDEVAGGAGSVFSAATAGSLVRVTEESSGRVIVDLRDLGGWLGRSSASCSSFALLAQLNATVLEFPDVERVRYELDGHCEVLFNTLQRECIEFDRVGAIELPLVERAGGSGCTPGDSLGDGRWYGLVPDGFSTQSLDFDLACWFLGAAAAEAAAEDGEESPPNDYYVRNTVANLRTLAIHPSATVLWYPDGGDPNTSVETDVAAWLAGREERGFGFGVWIDTTDETVIRIVEEWVP